MGFCSNRTNVRSELNNFETAHCSPVDKQASIRPLRVEQNETAYCSQIFNPSNNNVFCAHGCGYKPDQVARYDPYTSSQLASQTRPVDWNVVSSPVQPCPPSVVNEDPDVAQLSQSMADCFVIREFAGKCFNCKNAGHHWRNCQQPKKFFCHRCGFEGKTLQSCPNCTGNRQAESRQ